MDQLIGYSSPFLHVIMLVATNIIVDGNEIDGYDRVTFEGFKRCVLEKSPIASTKQILRSWRAVLKDESVRKV